MNNSDSPNKRKFAVLASVAISVAALFTAINYVGLISIHPVPLAIVRWLAVAALCAYATVRRSLTTWILVAMVAGAEFGHDFPNIAVHARVLSLIFLRLIKTIIAPLIFATLVVGIAGHSNLKQVGRMGIKALI